MGAPTDYFTNFSTGTDDAAAGRGDSAGDPWKTVQHAADTITRDSTNGDRVNVDDTAADTTTAPLDLTTYGSPGNLNTPFIVEGMTDAAGDGGIGDLDGGGSNAIINDANVDAVIFKNMRLHNCGSASVATVDNFCMFFRFLDR